MKSVITGSSGFIGKHIVAKLNDLGHKIFPIPRADLSDKELLARQIEDIRPDYIFHLASYGNHSQQQDAETTIATNILKTYYLLEVSKKVPYKAFINFSSSSVDLPYETFYSATKAAAERLCNIYTDQYKKKIITIRPASVFGEGEAPFRFIPTVIKNMLVGTSMNLDPLPKHSWIYIHDFVDAVFEVIKNKDKVGRGEAVNISYGKQWTNLEVVEVLEEMSGKKLLFKDAERMRPYDSGEWLVNNDKLFSFAWRPEHGLEKGLLDTYKYYETYGFE